MTDTKTNETAAETALPENQPADHAAQDDAAPAEDSIDPVQQRIEALEQEAANAKDQLLRTLAEMENLRRRTEKEIRDAKQYSAASFARDMLTVGDNLTRALDAVPEESRNSDDAGLKALIEGVEMTGREMNNLLEKHGVKKLDPEGQKFDPNFHQAMFEIPNTDVPNNTVLQVMQAGYVIGDRVLRPAMVGVSKGGPKERKPEGNAEPGSRVDTSA
ncbi:nucleotide exchange factor GrpE [Coralliovum pocilloporae]|uniref:nucleotide exchange factor GrpE n=1 Tax=Coralliovum pocilloporae TaxID=3066369 RepID=UPI003306A8A1